MQRNLVKLWIIAGLLIASCKVMPPEEQKIDKLVQGSTYIFSGTVQKLGAAHMASVPVSDNTAIVKVDDHVYTAVDVLGDLTNKEVTVQLKEIKTIDTGWQAIFFTNGWIYGSGVALVEFGRLKVEDPEKFTMKVAESLKRKEEQKLKKRLDSASVVVVSKIKETKPLNLDHRLPITEHSPDWWEAIMQITSV